MQTVPKDILVKLALDLDLPDLLNLCQVNKQINQKICASKDFWKQKLWKDYNLTSENPKAVYENLDKCNQLLLKGGVIPNGIVLNSYSEEYFNNKDDYLVYLFLIAKILNKDEEIPEYFEGIYDRYNIKNIYPQIERTEVFTEKDYEVFLKLLGQIKSFGNFEKSYINSMLRGDVPFSVTWEQLCQIPFY